MNRTESTSGITAAAFPPDILRVIERTDRVLWASYESSVRPGTAVTGAKILFPKYKVGSEKTVRVSEQEARFAFVAEVTRTAFLYSLETPTAMNYRQKGVGERSAVTDVTLYGSSRRPVLNVEFKEGGFSPKRKSAFVIAKDLEKILKEQPNALWFHTLEAVNNSTLTTLWTVFCQELSRIARKYQASVVAKELLFHACVLRQKFSVQHQIAIDPKCIDDKWSLTVPCFGYKVSRSEVRSLSQSNHWRVTQ